MITVSVIIVSWNVEGLIEACLRSIPAALGSLSGEILVVDNASQDATVLRIRKLSPALPQLTLLEQKQNLGFAKANNLALRQAGGEYLLLLNPDTVLTPGAIEQLVACAQQCGAGIVGGRHANVDKTLQPSVRRLPSPQAMALVLLKLHRLLPNNRIWQRYLAKDFDYSRTQPAQQVAGSCLLITRTAFDRIGPLDERFRVWFEEVDWCARARAAGITVVYCSSATLTHYGAASFNQLGSLARQTQFNRSLRRYAKKHFSPLAWVLLSMLSPFSLVLAAATPRRKKMH